MVDIVRADLDTPLVPNDETLVGRFNLVTEPLLDERCDGSPILGIREELLEIAVGNLIARFHDSNNAA